MAGLAARTLLSRLTVTTPGGIDELHRLPTADSANQSILVVILRGVEKRLLTLALLSKEGVQEG